MYLAQPLSPSMIHGDISAAFQQDRSLSDSESEDERLAQPSSEVAKSRKQVLSPRLPHELSRCFYLIIWTYGNIVTIILRETLLCHSRS